MTSPRLIAVKILNKFYNNNSTLDEIFFNHLITLEKENVGWTLSNTDKKLVSELIYGVVRWQV